MILSTDGPSKNLRLLFPQWQGGNNELYSLGARLLAWLAPESDAPLLEVPLEPHDEAEPKRENGIAWQSVLLKQLRAARSIIDVHEPDRIVVFGGDCLISQAPFAYLNEKHGGKLGVLWIDAHPDVSTPDFFHHEHAMVLGNLLGEGDPMAGPSGFRTVCDHPKLGGGVGGGGGTYSQIETDVYLDGAFEAFSGYIAVDEGGESDDSKKRTNSGEDRGVVRESLFFRSKKIDAEGT